jgi:hypothetical protein
VVRVLRQNEHFSNVLIVQGVGIQASVV